MSDNPLKRTDEEWRRILTPEQYRVLRQSGTEPAFTGKYYDHHAEGIYLCGACGEELFASGHKYDSGSGWPSFDRPMTDAVTQKQDDSYGMNRTEVNCARCGSHLGHVFNDGPPSTGKRFCINSASLNFRASE